MKGTLIGARFGRKRRPTQSRYRRKTSGDNKHKGEKILHTAQGMHEPETRGEGMRKAGADGAGPIHLPDPATASALGSVEPKRIGNYSTEFKQP